MKSGSTGTPSNETHSMVVELPEVVHDVADALRHIDSSAVAFKGFQPGVGPYGEPQLLRALAERLAQLPAYAGRVATRRTPDLLVTGAWAMEFKIARPFGDNGKQAEDWSVNLLHPYAGNVSLLGDCLKLEAWPGQERRAAFVIGYEHTPPQVELEPLLGAFEVIARSVLGLTIGHRVEANRGGLIHPVHQQLRVVAWEVVPRTQAVAPSTAGNPG